MSETHYSLPLPELDGLHKEFYDHCKSEALSFQRCSLRAEARRRNPIHLGGGTGLPAPHP
jgi:hypothetical protein